MNPFKPKCMFRWTDSVKIQFHSQIKSQRYLLHSVQTQLKRTTANLICIVCHALWLRDWNICHREGVLSLFYINMYYHPLTTQCCVVVLFAVYFYFLLLCRLRLLLFRLLSLHFVSSPIVSTKEAIFSSCIGFLIHHFVVIALFFCTIYFFHLHLSLLLLCPGEYIVRHRWITKRFVPFLLTTFIYDFSGKKNFRRFFFSSLLVLHFNFFSPFDMKKGNNVFVAFYSKCDLFF